jgi:Flp pilus assembly protein TadB
MPDKMEREIEEILAKLDGETPRTASEKAPISILSRRKRTPNPVVRASQRSSSVIDSINPTTLLFGGAIVMIAGLIGSLAYGPLIWASFAGVVIFLCAFLWSFRRTPRTTASGPMGAAPRGHYWRDRYIEYPLNQTGPLDKLKKRFRRH